MAPKTQFIGYVYLSETQSFSPNIPLKTTQKELSYEKTLLLFLVKKQFTKEHKWHMHDM